MSTYHCDKAPTWFLSFTGRLVVSPTDQLEIPSLVNTVSLQDGAESPKGEASDEWQSFLISIDELREGRERICCIDRVPEVGDEDRCPELDRRARCYGSQDDEDVPVAQIIVDPHLIEVVPAR